MQCMKAAMASNHIAYLLTINSEKIETDLRILSLQTSRKYPGKGGPKWQPSSNESES